MTQYQKDYLKTRFISEMLKIIEKNPSADHNEDLKLIMMEIVKMVENGLCDFKTAGDFLTYLVDLAEIVRLNPKLHEFLIFCVIICVGTTRRNTKILDWIGCG